MSWWLLFAPHMAAGTCVCVLDGGVRHVGVIQRLQILRDGSCRISFLHHSIDLQPLKEIPR